MEIIEKIRKGIERLNDLNKQIAKEQGGTDFIKGITAGYAEVLCLLDSLQEETPIDLEEEVIRLGWSESVEDCNNFHLTCGDGAADINDVFSLARHFYELGQSQMPMPEDTVLFQKGVAEGRRLEREDMMKVKVKSDCT